MARFQLEKQITSCCVNKELLKQLEHFLAIEIPKMIDIPKYKIQESFSLSIIDNLEPRICKVYRIIPLPFFLTVHMISLWDLPFINQK